MKKCKKPLLAAIILMGGVNISYTSDIATNVLDFLVVNGKAPDVLEKVMVQYGVVICGEFIAPRSDFGIESELMSFQLKNATWRDVLNSLVSKDSRYVWRLDGATGIVNVFPSSGSLLNWNAPKIDVVNMSLAQFLWDTVKNFEQWKAQAIYIEPWRGSTAWANVYRINMKSDERPIREVLNSMCSQLTGISNNTIWRWEIAGDKSMPVFRLRKRTER